MHESQTPIQPLVDDEYFFGYGKYTPTFESLLDHYKNVKVEKEANFSFTLISPALSNSPYILNCKLHISPGNHVRCELRIVNKDLSPINNEEKAKTGMNLYYDDILKEVSTEVWNDSTKAASKPITQSPILNVSGILAPIDDGFCQAIANTWGPITGMFDTEKPKSENDRARFISNYSKRGFTVKPTRLQNVLHMEKSFAPNK